MLTNICMSSSCCYATVAAACISETVVRYRLVENCKIRTCYRMRFVLKAFFCNGIILLSQIIYYKLRCFSFSRLYVTMRIFCAGVLVIKCKMPILFLTYPLRTSQWCTMVNSNIPCTKPDSVIKIPARLPFKLVCKVVLCNRSNTSKCSSSDF